MESYLRDSPAYCYSEGKFCSQSLRQRSSEKLAVINMSNINQPTIGQSRPDLSIKETGTLAQETSHNAPSTSNSPPTNPFINVAPPLTNTIVSSQPVSATVSNTGTGPTAVIRRQESEASDGLFSNTRYTVGEPQRVGGLDHHPQWSCSYTVGGKQYLTSVVPTKTAARMRAMVEIGARIEQLAPSTHDRSSNNPSLALGQVQTQTACPHCAKILTMTLSIMLIISSLIPTTEAGSILAEPTFNMVTATITAATGGTAITVSGPVYSVLNYFPNTAEMCQIEYSYSMWLDPSGASTLPAGQPFCAWGLTLGGPCSVYNTRIYDTCGPEAIVIHGIGPNNPNAFVSTTGNYVTTVRCSNFYRGSRTGGILDYNLWNSIPGECGFTLNINARVLANSSFENSSTDPPANVMNVNVVNQPQVSVLNFPTTQTVFIPGTVSVAVQNNPTVTLSALSSVSIIGTPTVNIQDTVSTPIFAVIAGITAGISIPISTPSPIPVSISSSSSPVNVNFPTNLNVTVTNSNPILTHIDNPAVVSINGTINLQNPLPVIITNGTLITQQALTSYGSSPYNGHSVSQYSWPASSTSPTYETQFSMLSRKKRNKMAHSENGNTSIMSETVFKILESSERHVMAYWGERLLGRSHEHVSPNNRGNVELLCKDNNGNDIKAELDNVASSPSVKKEVLQSPAIVKQSLSSVGGSNPRDKKTVAVLGCDEKEDFKQNVNSQGVRNSIRRICNKLKTVKQVVCWSLRHSIDKDYLGQIVTQKNFDLTSRQHWNSVLLCLLGDSSDRDKFNVVSMSMSDLINLKQGDPVEWDLFLDDYFSSIGGEYTPVDKTTLPIDVNKSVHLGNSNPDEKEEKTAEYPISNYPSWFCDEEVEICHTIRLVVDLDSGTETKVVRRNTSDLIGSLDTEVLEWKELKDVEYEIIGAGLTPGRSLSKKTCFQDYGLSIMVAIRVKYQRLIGGSSTGDIPTEDANMLAASTADVEKCSKIDSFPDDSSAPNINPQRLQERLTGIGAPYVINNSTGVQNNVYNIRMWDNTNVLQNNGDSYGLNTPALKYYPTTVRAVVAAGNALVNNPIPPGIIYCRTKSRSRNKTLILSIEADAAVKLSTSSGIRPGSINTNVGLRIDDISRLGSLAENTTNIGNSLASVFLSGHLKAMILAEESVMDVGAVSSMGLSNQISFDRYSQLSSVFGGATNAVNDIGTAPNFNMSCGGVGAFFPFQPGVPNGGGGTISFHQTMETVRNKNSVLFIPPGLLQDSTSGFDLAVNIAYMTMLFSAYPQNIHTSSFNTLDTTGIAGTTFLQSFVHFANLVAISGLTELEVLLPIGQSSKIPTNQGQANSNLFVAPTWGPTATVTQAAGAVLNVCFVALGGGNAVYNLCEYILSWEAAMTHDGLIKFMRSLAGCLDKWKDYYFGLEAAHVLGVRYMQLNITTPGTNPIKISPVTIPGQTSLMYDSLVVRPLQGNLPEQIPNNPEYTIPSCDINYVSFILAKICDAGYRPDTTSNTMKILEYSQNDSQLSLYPSLIYAATESYVYKLWNIPSSLWNVLNTQTLFLALRESLLQNFTTSQDDRGVFVAPLGIVRHRAMAHYTGFSPSTDDDGYCLFDFKTFPGGQNRFSPFLTVVAANVVIPVYDVVPSVLPDPWLYAMSKKVPKSLQVWPRPNDKGAHGVGLLTKNESSYGPQALTVNGVATYSVPMSMNRYQSQLKTNEFPIWDEDEEYNKRLSWYGQTGMQLTYTNGAVVPTTVTSALNPGVFASIVVNPTITVDFTIPSPAPRQAPVSCTTWIPNIDSTGKTIIMCASDGPTGASLLNKLNGSSFFSLWVAGYHNRDIIPLVILSSGSAVLPGWMKSRKNVSEASKIDSTVNLAIIPVISELSSSESSEMNAQ
jgi:hypothetical protein